MLKRIILIGILTVGLLLSCSKEDTVVSNGEIPLSAKQANLRVTGSSSNDFLSDATFKSVLLEVVYVEGFEPTAAALNNLKTFLEARLNKSSGIEILMRSIPPPGNSPYTNEEIRAIEDANRRNYNVPNQIAVWAFFADGSSADNTTNSVILGTAYRNTSFVIYEATIRSLTTNPFGPSRTVLETAVTNHEFGHILGLTNLGASLQTNHEDPANSKHCVNDKCLMYFAAETSQGIGDMVSGGAAPGLDADCIADLRANGGK